LEESRKSAGAARKFISLRELFAYGLYHWVSRPFYRIIGQDPDVRDDGTHINVNETIDAACSSDGGLIQRIARTILPSGRIARKLTPPSCRLLFELTILA
jgi:hypothetical protein